MPAGELATEPLPVPASATVSWCVIWLNVAVTLRASLIVTLQVVALPEHAPDHDLSVWPEFGDAVSVTSVPSSWVVQPVPQLGPLGFLDTVPEPVVVTVSSQVLMKFAAIARAELPIWLLKQVAPVPEQSPLQLPKREPAAGVAVNVTLSLGA